MPQYVPVEHDPFATTTQAAPQFIPVEHDPFASIPSPPAAEEPKTPDSFLRSTLGIGELALQAATGTAIGIPAKIAAGYAGLGKRFMGATPEEATKAIHGMEEAAGKFIYEPKYSEGAKAVSEAIGYGMAIPGKIGKFAGEAAQTGLRPIIGEEAAAATGTALGTAGEFLPYALGLKSGLKAEAGRKAGIQKLKTLQKTPEWQSLVEEYPALKSSKMQLKITQELQKTTSSAEDIVAATRLAEKTKEKIGGGFELRRGQIMNDQEALQIERNLMMNPAEKASGLERIRRDNAEKALESYYQAKVLKGEAGVGEVSTVASDIQKRLSENTKKAQEALDIETKAQQAMIEETRGSLERGVVGPKEKLRKIQEGIPEVEDAQALGKRAYDVAREAESKSRELMGEAYANVPNVKGIAVNEVADAMIQLKKEAAGIKDPSITPLDVLGEIESEIMSPATKKPIWNESLGWTHEDIPPVAKSVDLKTLIDAEQRVNRLYGEALRKVPDSKYERSLAILKSAINKSMDAVEGSLSENAVATYRAAKQTASEHFDKFGKGPIGDLLQRGKRGEEARIPMSEMAGKVFKAGAGAPEAADAFITALGGNKQLARESVKDYAMYKFLKDMGDKPITFEKLNSWAFKHRTALDKFDLKSEFTDIAKTAKSLDVAMERAATFEKTALVKAVTKGSTTSKAIESAIGAEKQFAQSPLAQILSADSDKAMQAIYSNKNLRDSIKTTRDIVNILKASKNDAAIEGFKNAFVEHLKREAQRKLKSEIGANKTYTYALKKIDDQYKGAIRELFKDEPERIAALRTIQRGFELSGLEATGLISGSQSASNLMGYASKVLGHIPGAKNVQTVLRFLEEQNLKQANEILTGVSFSPPMAKTIVDMVQGRMAVKDFKTRMSGHLKNMAVAGEIKAQESLKPYREVRTLSSLSDKELIEQIRRSK